MRWIPHLLAGSVLLYAAAFDAASIKPSDAPSGSSGVNYNNGYLRANNVTLKRCISGAYGVPEAQITGGPKWIEELRYDITARGTGADTMDMLQTLLADRFHLALHHQTQTVSGYTLIVAKGGIKAAVTAPETRASTNSARTRIDAKGCPMSRLASKLSGYLSVPVVDETQDSRSFDFILEWAPDSDTNGPSIFTAVQEQLGLKLEARKVPVDFLVIDRADPPSEN